MFSKVGICYLLFLLLVTLLLRFAPGHNGDMPFYIACAIEKEQGGQIGVLERTKQILKAELPTSEYVIHARRIDAAGIDILDFYRIKPVYIYIIFLLHKIGLSYTLSTQIPSLIAYFLIGVLTYIWASKILPPGRAALFSGLIMLMYPVIILARLSTPDAMSNLFILAALYALYFEKNKYLGILLLFCSLTIRMDNFVALMVILTGLKFMPPNHSAIKLNLGTYFILVGSAIAIVFGLNDYLPNDFWWFKKITYIGSPGQYGRQLLTFYLSASRSLIMALIVFYLLLYFKNKSGIKEKDNYFLFILMGVFIVRMVLFPSFEERFFGAFYICLLMIFAEISNPTKVIYAKST